MVAEDDPGAGAASARSRRAMLGLFVVQIRGRAAMIAAGVSDPPGRGWGRWASRRARSCSASSSCSRRGVVPRLMASVARWNSRDCSPGDDDAGRGIGYVT
jgi:hypothetical protein